MKPRFIISGGGTGGHIYPAIAIANELKSRFPDCEILFVGASDKMEMQKVPQAGYEIEGLWISGIQRKLSFDNMKFPFKLLSSLLKSKKIIKKFKPNIAIGTGGFASGAVVKVASQMGIPTVIQEQNSYPGITNKLLSKKAKAICVAYEGLEKYFPKDKMILTGNPVRQDLLNVAENRQDAIKHFYLDSNKKTLLVLGGSLGSRRINQLIESEMDFILSQNVQIIWQCGKFYYEEYKKYNEKEGVQVLSFIDQMDLVYAAADMIISRAGASSVSELAIVGKPTIFIPSPNVAEDHQTKNAKAIADKKGAILLKESELDARFKNVFSEVIQNEELQKELSQNIKALAKPDATKDIVNSIVKLLRIKDDFDFSLNLDKYANTDVLKQYFSFLKDYGLKVTRESNSFYGASIDYAGNGVKISLGFDFREYFFYFYIYKGENTPYSDNNSARIKTFYDLAKKGDPEITLESLQPNLEQGYKIALENNVRVLEQYGQNIITGREWF